MLSQEALIHVTSPEAWAAAAPTGYYPPGFEAEGFCHCCHRSQLETVLADHFATQDEVLLLVLNRAAIAADVRYERAANGDDYPHIYGAIESSAVVEAIPAKRVAGQWQLP